MMIKSGLRCSDARIEQWSSVRLLVNVAARCVLPPTFMLKLLECDGAENLPETVVALAAEAVTTRQRNQSAKRPLHDALGVQSAPDSSRQPRPHEPDERRTVTPHNFRPGLRIVPFQKIDNTLTSDPTSIAAASSPPVISIASRLNQQHRPPLSSTPETMRA
jgi:hypothetical protein